MVLKKTVPVVAAGLRSMTGVIHQGQTSVAAGLDAVMERLDLLHDGISNLTHGTFSLQFSPGRSRLLPQGYDAAAHRRDSSPISLSRGSAAAPSVVPPRAFAAASVASAALASLGGPAPLAPSAIEQVGDRAPLYKLSRETRTVPALWVEWTEGLVGFPSVDELDRRWGTAWRSVKERQFYSTRKVLIEEVRRRAGGEQTGPRCKKVVDDFLLMNVPIDSCRNCKLARKLSVTCAEGSSEGKGLIDVLDDSAGRWLVGKLRASY